MSLANVELRQLPVSNQVLFHHLPQPIPPERSALSEISHRLSKLPKLRLHLYLARRNPDPSKLPLQLQLLLQFLLRFLMLLIILAQLHALHGGIINTAGHNLSPAGNRSRSLSAQLRYLRKSIALSEDPLPFLNLQTPIVDAILIHSNK